jgi:hypothetical protein
MKKIFKNEIIQYLAFVFVGVLFIFAGMYIWAPLAIIGFIIFFLAALIGLF